MFTSKFSIEEAEIYNLPLSKLLQAIHLHTMDDVVVKDVGHPYCEGTPLLEVFSISITKKFDAERRSEVYGTIRVTDGRGTEAVLYERDCKNCESISSNKTLTLMGPPRCISAQSGFRIDLDLKERYQDLEISKGKVCWDMKCLPNFAYLDKFLSIDVPGRDGFATINCTILSAGMQANVGIVFRRNDGDSYIDIPVEFHGTVVAYYVKKFDYPCSGEEAYFRTTLLNSSSNNCLKLEPGQYVPLVKSVVAVPSNLSLVIEVDLVINGSDVQILRGTTGEVLPGPWFNGEIQGEGLFAEVEIRWISALE